MLLCRCCYAVVAKAWQPITTVANIGDSAGAGHNHGQRPTARIKESLMLAGYPRRALVALACAGLTALTLSVVATPAAAGSVGVASASSVNPVVTIHDGAIRGT